ncbi:non-ribosomal peptide synthetase [Streptomyces sp. H51]|uniref:non-ribosomal peptide synthetase n=1 Tax=Streptomyces sp. H51 TaxID=3111770 RepID=UPI002D79B666|nr:non-ribosomal peptide synthetase [Streptomyces sp. H51]
MARPALENILPLSPMQEGMLFHSLMDPDGGVDFEQLLYRLDGDLDVAAFTAAWQAVSDRHTALRVRLVWRGVERPLQLVERGVTVPVTVLDWSADPEAGRQKRLERLLEEDRAAGFDLSRAPLLRITLIRTGARAHRMVLSFHHVLLDGWSVRLVLREVMACYRAALRGEPHGLEPAPDYAAFIRWLGAQDAEEARRYWKAELGGFTTPTRIVGERPTGETGFATEGIAFDAEETRRLRETARRERVTVNTLLLGAWGLLLSRYSGNADVVFGATTSTRPAELPGVESMVGLMINTLPTTVRVRPSERVGDWLRGVQDSQQRARQFDYTPLVEAQASSGVPQGSVLFDTLLVFENYPAARPQDTSADGLEMTPEGAVERNGYPLSVVAAARDVLRVEITYDRALFDAGRIARMAGHLRTAVNGLAAGPDAAVAEVPILPPEEWHTVVHGWNDTAAPFPDDATVQELFERWAAKQPDAPALHDVDGTTWTYGELNARANRLAHHLRALGAGPERCVGLCASASVEAVTGILGILKSGSAYVPLDPSYPEQRLAFMLQDTAADLVVAEAGAVSALPGDHRDRAIVLDPQVTVAAGLPETDPVPRTGADHLAYVMYTSGSTGRPKGTLIPHRGLVNYLWWCIEGYGLGGASGAPMLGSIAADLGMPNYLLPLIGGKDVTLLPTERSLDSLRERLLRPADFSLLKITPGHLDVLRASMNDERVESVRTFVVGADEVKPETLAAWRRVAPGARLINEYGPTETVVGCSVYVAGDDFDPSVPVPIGRPIANIRMYVLDEDMAPLPAGVVGELFIGGVGVARGYLGRPGLTAERFVPDPFVPGRLYRTGDLARFRADGELEFLGRADNQVKIRGYRVELGEVEARLLSCEGVTEAVVAAREDTPGDRRLVAYLVTDGRSVPITRVREWLRETLPEHMVPAVFVTMPELPLSGIGKVDRSALPAPDSARPELGTAFVAPRTKTERDIAAVWGEVLGVDSVGVRDDFFALGGHSLLATRVVSRLARDCGVEVPLRAVFEAPTVAGLAAYVDGAAGGAGPDTAIGAADRGGPLPLSFGQQRLWFMDQLDPGSVEYVVPMAWRLRGPVDVAALRSALAAVVARHEVLRSAVTAAEGRAWLRIDDSVPVELPVVEAGGRLDEVVAELARRPFDLSRAPLWHAALVRESATDHVLLLAFHHSVADAWSAGVLVREISAGYRAALAGTALELPALPVQYADYAAWQRGWLTGDVLESQLAYWRDMLGGLEPLELPTDRPRAAVRATQGGSVDFAVPAEVTAGLRRLGQERHVTLFMVVLACFQALLARHSGQDDIAVGTPIAGRNRAETEPLIGFFVNTLVLRTDLSGDPTFTELLTRVRDVTLDAYEHQDLPFERLVEELRPERDLARTPLFQTMLSLDTTQQATWNLPHIDAEDHSLTSGEVKVDLTAALADTADGLIGTLRYSTALFDADRMDRMAQHLKCLFAAVAADPGVRLSQIPVLPDAEYRQVVLAPNATDRPRPTRALHELVTDVAARQPEAVALVTPGGPDVSYGVLDARANRLAHRLRALGVGPESVVGICLPRSADAVTAQLAVLKAGGAFLPLDPGLPAERLELMADATTAGFVVTSRHAASAVPARHREAAVYLESVDWSALPDSAPAGRTDADHAAYVMYTSGSTGRPKGVVTTHANAVSHLEFLREEYGLGPADTLAAIAAPGFDASVREVFGALGSGARLLVTPPGAAQEPRQVADLLAEYRVTVLPSVVPSLLYELADVPVRPGSLDGLRLVLCSGERLRADRIAHCPWLHDRVVNQFGPTETTMTTTRTRAPRHDDWTYPVGRPITGSRVYVLDPHLSPCPIGVPGELFIGGTGVARGYLGQPALTAERFLPDPFTPGRLYRTGDICRWTADGRLEHLGRTDHQIKIRGMRIEPGEIETRLVGHEAVTEAVVVAREDTPGEPRLIGYLVAAPGGRPTVGELRSWLEPALPEHMVPSAFVVLPALPRTPNGKVDRAALPAVGAERPHLEAAFIAPRSPWEQVVAAVWADVLDVDGIGLDDDFFDLGGHSLLAAHVIARMRSRHGVTLPLRSLFGAPTVREFAGLIDRPEPGRQSAHGLVDLTSSTAPQTLFCVHEGTGSITGYYEMARMLRDELAVTGIEFDESLVDSGAPDPLAAMASAYVRLVTERRPKGPYLLCGWSMGGVIAYEMAAQLHRAGHEVAWVGLVDSVVAAPETANRDRVDRLLEELLDMSGRIPEREWADRAPGLLAGHMRQLDLREEQIGLGKDALEKRLRRNRFFREAKRTYRPVPADVPLHVLRAENGNWDRSWFDAWRDYAPRTAVTEVPGTHLSVMERPHLERVVGWLRDTLEAGRDDA